MENGMYVHAIQVYQKLLEENDLEEYGQGLTAKVCHNLGCAFSYLFQMEKPWSISERNGNRAAKDRL